MKRKQPLEYITTTTKKNPLEFSEFHEKYKMKEHMDLLYINLY